MWLPMYVGLVQETVINGLRDLGKNYRPWLHMWRSTRKQTMIGSVSNRTRQAQGNRMPSVCMWLLLSSSQTLLTYDDTPKYIPPNRWTGKCWTFYKGIRYEYELEFDIPVTYPVTNPDLCLPELDGKTAKMYRGGKICLDIHFQPLWQRNVPKFGIAHALALGLGPWLAAEIPDLVESGKIIAS